MKLVECVDCGKLIPSNSQERRCDDCWDLYWKRFAEINDKFYYARALK